MSSCHVCSPLGVSVTEKAGRQPLVFQMQAEGCQTRMYSRTLVYRMCCLLLQIVVAAVAEVCRSRRQWSHRSLIPRRIQWCPLQLNRHRPRINLNPCCRMLNLKTIPQVITTERQIQDVICNRIFTLLKLITIYCTIIRRMKKNIKSILYKTDRVFEITFKVVDFWCTICKNM